MKTGNFLEFLKFDEDFCEAAAECGLRSFIIMAGALNGKKVKSELLSYEGPFGVGYAVAAFTVTGNDESRRFDEIFIKNEMERIDSLNKEKDEYLRIARHTLESYIVNHKIVDRPGNLGEELTNRKAGVFVSLYLDGNLRGCIGTIIPTTDSVADEIIQNSISAGTEDPRFHPITESELPRLVYSVDILGKAEKIKSINELDPLKYGIIVTRGNKRGLLLPNLEGINSPSEQLSIALKKAGILPSENYGIERFEVVRHK
jgi:AmmeMemoRadiSam system protein A